MGLVGMKKLSRFIYLSGLLLVLQNCQSDCAKPKRCELESETGPCKALFIKFYYDKNENRCKEFVWGGCNGVVPFNTLEECSACECSK